LIVMLANNIGGYNYRKDIYNPVDKYINHIKVALLSLTKTGCCLPITVYLIDCVPEIGKDLKKLYKNLKVENIPITAQKRKTPCTWGGNPLRFVMMREKILAVKKALADDNNKWVLFIDCDVIIRGSLVPLVNGLVGRCRPYESRLTVLHRPEIESDGWKFNSGVIGLTNTPATKELADLWYKESLSHDELSCEQEGLYKAYSKMKDKIKLIPLESRFNGWNFRDDPVIYHCKGKYFNYLPFKSLFFPLLFEAQRKCDIYKIDKRDTRYSW